MKAKRLSAIFLAACFACSPLVSAEVKTYEGTGEYIMSDFETPDIAKQRAKARAEQNCVEQAGVYVKSYTRTVNHVVAEDEVEAIANTIINIIGEKFVVIPVSEAGGSFRIVATVKATVDSERIDAWMARDHVKNMELVEENRRLQEEKAKQDVVIAELRNKLLVANSEQEKKKIEFEVAGEDRKFLANQKLEEGRRLFNLGRYGDSLEAFSKAIELDEINSNAYRGRATVYGKQGNHQLEIEDYNRAIEINPKDTLTYCLRGFAYGMQGNYTQAIIDFNKAIELNPVLALDAYYGRGVTYAEQHKYQQAIEDFNKYIEIDSSFFSVYRERGNAYYKQGKYKNAIEDYNKAIQLNQKDANVYEKCGDAYFEQGDYDLAIDCFNNAIRLNPQKIRVYGSRGLAYMVKGDFQEALNDFNAVIERNPKDGMAYHIRGFCYSKLGDVKKANLDYAMAKKLGYKG